MGYKDPDKNREYQRNWFRKKTNKLARRASKLKYKYGISLEDYDNLLKKQGGKCAICGYYPSENEYLPVDHDHTTGKVRGILCTACNIGLGTFQDNIEHLSNAIGYLTSHRLVD